MATLPNEHPQKKPSWLKVKLPTHQNFFYVSSLISEKNLNTICQSAKCPNRAECWTQKTATFMILGNICTRDCAFCAVTHGQPKPDDLDEPERIADAVSAMGLRYAVVTSVTRDDLSDGGASRFAAVIKAIRRLRTETRVEVLIPDFKGDTDALDEVLDAGPDVLNHNLEVPEPLYPAINRPKDHYTRSLDVLAYAKKRGAVTKSGLMVGLGESKWELYQTYQDLRKAGCNLLTIGQYLQATKNNASIVKYYTPDEFACLRDSALELGFHEVEAGPLVRSSYRAYRLFQDLIDGREKAN